MPATPRLNGNARDGLEIDPELGKMPADYQYLYSLMQGQAPSLSSDYARAAMALSNPEPDIPTQFLKFPKGYCLFVPVWWPNKDIESTDGRKDLRDYIEFPSKVDIGLEKEPEDKEEPELTLLALKDPGCTWQGRPAPPHLCPPGSRQSSQCLRTIGRISSSHVPCR